MDLKSIYGPVAEELALVEARLVELTRSGNEAISEAVSAMMSGGKRLRPALLLIAAKACDYAGERAVRLAAAVELVHTASLIHDDVIDNADQRRGKSTVSAGLGNTLAVLVGDNVYSKVMSILAEDGDLKVMQAMADTACTMTEGEAIQSLCRNDISMTEQKYLAIIAGKTAALISCSCRVGAMLGDVRNGEVDILDDYGMNLGMAFQIVDDLLDIKGEDGRLGKSSGKDIREGSLTLPLIYAVREADGKDRQWILDVFESGRRDETDVARLEDMVFKYGGMEYGLEKAKQYGAACKERLKTLKESESRTSLATLADYVVERGC